MRRWVELCCTFSSGVGGVWVDWVCATGYRGYWCCMVSSVRICCGGGGFLGVVWGSAV